MNREIRELRRLASRYYDLAMREDNFENMKLHRDSNDLKIGTRPVVLLNEIPWHELEPAEELRPLCEDPVLRDIETQIRRTLFQKKYFPGDMVIQPFIGVNKVVLDENQGLKPLYTAIDRNAGSAVKAHQFETQLRSMEDLEKISYEKLVYKEDETMRRYEIAADALGDILPIKLVGQYAVMGINNTPMDLLAQYIHLDDLFYDMVDEPEMIHAFVARLTDVFLDRMRQFEELDLLEGDSYDLHCTPALTNDLHPDRDHVTLDQVWGRSAAQILSVASADMTEEFDIDYQMKAMAPFGLVYYGCCEPLDKKMHIVEKIPHLRKVTVTPWADKEAAIEAISGRFVVSAKANPGLVATGSPYMDAIEKEIRTVVDACRRYGCTCDLVLKDISTVSGRTESLMEWERTAMRLVQEF